MLLVQPCYATVRRGREEGEGEGRAICCGLLGGLVPVTVVEEGGKVCVGERGWGEDFVEVFAFEGGGVDDGAKGGDAVEGEGRRSCGAVDAGFGQCGEDGGWYVVCLRELEGEGIEAMWGRE